MKGFYSRHLYHGLLIVFVLASIGFVAPETLEAETLKAETCSCDLTKRFTETKFKVNQGCSGPRIMEVCTCATSCPSSISIDTANAFCKGQTADGIGYHEVGKSKCVNMLGQQGFAVICQRRAYLKHSCPGCLDGYYKVVNSKGETACAPIPN
jgi:hypothetical protein